MIVNEEDYLVHYGRKGMKWYQHIFGDEPKTRAEKKRAKTFDKNENEWYDAYWKAYRNEVELRRAYEEYNRTGSKKAAIRANNCISNRRKLADNMIKTMEILKENYKDLSKVLGTKGEAICRQEFGQKVYSIEELDRRVWDDTYDADTARPSRQQLRKIKKGWKD